MRNSSISEKYVTFTGKNLSGWERKNIRCGSSFLNLDIQGTNERVKCAGCLKECIRTLCYSFRNPRRRNNGGQFLVVKTYRQKRPKSPQESQFSIMVPYTMIETHSFSLFFEIGSKIIGNVELAFEVDTFQTHIVPYTFFHLAKGVHNSNILNKNWSIIPCEKTQKYLSYGTLIIKIYLNSKNGLMYINTINQVLMENTNKLLNCSIKTSLQQVLKKNSFASIQ